jgi:Tol biopolymer transport system component/DNA-binding winged helix-turn-helix (wHTH) protein
MDSLLRFTFGMFEFDQTAFRLLKSGVPVPVEPKALDLLQVLLERSPRVVDKAEIFAIVWKDVAVTDNALTRAIAQLRKALEDDPKSPRYIETIATRGYRFIANVTVEPAGERPRAAPASTPSRWVAAGVVSIVALLTWAGVSFVRPAAGGSVRSSADGGPDIERLATLRPRQLTSDTGFDGFLAYSPDGTRLAFSSDRSGALEIYVQGASTGSTPIALTSNGRHNVQPVWSPDGQFIAYHEMAGDGIWVVPSSGGTARRISDFGSHPAWSPDGTKLAFQFLPLLEITTMRRPGAPCTIWIVDMSARGKPTAVTANGTPAGPHLSPAWSPDSKLLFFAVPAGVEAGGGTALWQVDINQRIPREVTRSDVFSTDYALSPDGRGTYFVAAGVNTVWWLPLTHDGDVAGAPRPTGMPTAGSKIAHLRVSADGKRLTWTVLDTAIHLWATEPQTKSADRDSAAPAKPLTEGTVHYRLAAAAADGRIALVGSKPGASGSLFMLAGNGTLRQLTTDESDHVGPQWLPGEREIAFVSNHREGAGFWALEPDTGRERLLFRFSDLPRPADNQPTTAAPEANLAFTKDFSRLVMAVVQDGIPNLWVGGMQEQRPRGDLEQRTFEREGGSYPAWSPDGQWLAYQCAQGTDTHVCVIGANGGDRRQLTNQPGQSWVGGWAADNDQVLFAARRGAVWNVAAVSRSSGAVRTLTTFSEPRLYVRYPRWDASQNRVLFQVAETTSRIWSVDVSAALTSTK